ncbi:MAG: phosphopantetheine-binding protein [Thermodesulfobacteriota bacterium]|nr:phosphopantetheine-binding protein [Thermodesulfobacteriota bacterium]
MNEQAIYNELISIIEEFVKDEEALENASLETDIIKGLKVNSARLVDIIIKAEDSFDIEIDDDDADAIKTIGDAVRIIHKKTAPVGARV